MQKPNLSRDAYSVGIICALAKEKAAAKAMLDEVHSRLPPASGDENDYTFGKIGEHGVVIACLPGDMGTTSASAVAVTIVTAAARAAAIDAAQVRSCMDDPPLVAVLKIPACGRSSAAGRRSRFGAPFSSASIAGQCRR